MRRLWGSPGDRARAGPRRDRAGRGARGRPREGALDRRHQPGRLAARRRTLRRRAAARRAGGLPGRLLPDRDRRARARAAAGRAVAGEGRDDDELRAARVACVTRARSTRPARRCRTGRSSPASAARSGIARRSRGARPPGARRVRARRPRAGCAIRPGSRTRGCAATGRCSGRCPRPSTRAPSGSTARAGSARPTAARGSRRRRTPRPADPVDADYPARADDRPRRAAVAHDDAHGQVAVAAGRRAAAVRGAAPGRRGAGVEDGERVRVRSRRGLRGAARAGEPTPCRPGVAFAPFHWGALHLEPGAGALNDVTARDVDPVSLQPELKACAVRVEPVGVAAAPDAPGRRLVDRRRRDGRHGDRRGGARPRRRRWQITLVGREPDAPYNRVLLSQALAGGVADERLALRPSGSPTTASTLRLGAAARRIDTRRAEVELEDGARASVRRARAGHRLGAVAAAGRRARARAACSARSPTCARSARAAASRARAVVVGGGLLGLEAARGLRELGVRVTVVHLADRLMELQLDALAARLLERRIRALGIDVLLRAAHRGDHRRRASRSPTARRSPPTWSSSPPASGPRSRSPATPGSRSRRGVLVDDNLRASAPGVWAVGECAEHRGTVYGLWAPVLEQARAAGAAIAGRPAAFLGAVPATTLKVAGIDLFCAGRAAEPDDDGRGGDRARLAPRALPQARRARRAPERGDAARRPRRRARAARR